MSFSGQSTIILFEGKLCVLKYPNSSAKLTQLVDEIGMYSKFQNYPQLYHFIPKIVGCSPNENYIVIEYVGTSLNHISNFSFESAKESIFTCLLGFLTIVQYNFIHGDINANNITIRRLNRKVVIKLEINKEIKFILLNKCTTHFIDFGLSKQYSTNVISLIQKDIDRTIEILKTICSKTIINIWDDKNIELKNNLKIC